MKSLVVKPKQPTRGFGLLEGFLARKRAEKAKALIPKERREVLIDIGCGAYPMFLVSLSDFRVKIGIDREVRPEVADALLGRGIHLFRQDVEEDPTLRFVSESVDVVTLLAVLEHLHPQRARVLLEEVYRVLRPGGVVILTTPPPWTEYLLRILAKVRVVSPVEIEEHHYYYMPNTVRLLLVLSGFERENIETGYFELGMNFFVRATK